MVIVMGYGQGHYKTMVMVIVMSHGPAHQKRRHVTKHVHQVINPKVLQFSLKTCGQS